jgi:hypothetical protein
VTIAAALFPLLLQSTSGVIAIKPTPSAVIRGTIKKVREASADQSGKGMQGEIILRADPEKGTERVVIRVTNGTRIVVQKGASHCAAIFAYLAAGNRVEVRITRGASGVDPAQLVAREILVLNMSVFPPEGFAGDQPCHIADISTCSPLARTAIRRKHLPISAIHSCDDGVVTLDNGQTGNLVRITAGPGGDCPSGCIYQSYIGFFNRAGVLFDLPAYGERHVETAFWAHPPFNKVQEPNSSVENGIRQSYRTEPDFLEFTHVIGGSRVTRNRYRFSGEIFVYLDSRSREVWDTFGLRSNVKPLI